MGKKRSNNESRMTLRNCKPGDRATVRAPDLVERVNVVIAWHHPNRHTEVRIGGGLGPDALQTMRGDVEVVEHVPKKQRQVRGGAVADPLAGGWV